MLKEFKKWLEEVMKWLKEFIKWLFSNDAWKNETKTFYAKDFFGNQPINTPLSWVKDIIVESYKNNMDTYKQTIIALITAAFSGTLWAEITKGTNPINYRIYVVFWLSLIIVFCISYLRMKYKLALQNEMMAVILEHDCINNSNNCLYKHFPPTSSTASIVNLKETSTETTAGTTKKKVTDTTTITKPL